MQPAHAFVRRPRPFDEQIGLSDGLVIASFASGLSTISLFSGLGAASITALVLLSVVGGCLVGVRSGRSLVRVAVVQAIGVLIGLIVLVLLWLALSFAFREWMKAFELGLVWALAPQDDGVGVLPVAASVLLATLCAGGVLLATLSAGHSGTSPVGLSIVAVVLTTVSLVASIAGLAAFRTQSRAGPHGGAVFAIDASTGEIVWRADVSDIRFVAWIRVDGERVDVLAISSVDFNLCGGELAHRQFDARSGTRLPEPAVEMAERRALGGGVGPNPETEVFATTEGTSFLLEQGHGKPVVRARNAVSGKLRWSRPLPRLHAQPTDGRAALAEGLVYVAVATDGDYCPSSG